MAKTKAAPQMQDEEQEATATAAMKGEELLAYLESSGTPTDLVRQYRRNMPKDSTAEDVYRQMEADNASVSEGTLRKAGKFVWGPDFEPNRAEPVGAAEELLRLRQENDQLHARVATLNADRKASSHRVTFLEEEIRRLTSQVNFLKAGRSREDLAALEASQGAGIGNVHFPEQ